jgi:DedD protein
MAQQATGLAEQKDTEITLGTGKLLTFFFAAVVVCGLFFGLGFNLGRASAPQPDPNVVAAAPLGSNQGAAKPSATHPVAAVNPPAQQPSTPGDTTPATQQPASTPAAPDSKPAATPEPASTGGFVVQVAAVTHREDAEALSAALRQKSYPVFIVNDAPDKLFHVQVGPFSDRKDAQAMRDRLSAEGYNPIVK